MIKCSIDTVCENYVTAYISNSYVNLILRYELRNFLCYCTIITLIVGNFVSSTVGTYDISFFNFFFKITQTDHYTL
jgi:hypothetical protein